MEEAKYPFKILPGRRWLVLYICNILKLLLSLCDSRIGDQFGYLVLIRFDWISNKSSGSVSIGLHYSGYIMIHLQIYMLFMDQVLDLYISKSIRSTGSPSVTFAWHGKNPMNHREYHPSIKQNITQLPLLLHPFREVSHLLLAFFLVLSFVLKGRGWTWLWKRPS